MACKSCTETQFKTAFYAPYQPCQQAKPCADGCQVVLDTACVVYTGAALNNIGVDSNVCLETVLQKINEQLAVTTGSYTGYDQACLGPYTTQKQFVEGISQFVCDTQDQLDLFIDTTYPAAQQAIQDQINAINNPGITSCASVGIEETDDYVTVLQKLATGECNLYSMLDLSGANWSACFSLVGAPPTTPLQATNALISMICQVKASQGTSSLPIFNNLNTCLVGGTSTDTLVTTITLMKNKLCQTPDLNINTLTFGCTSKPSNNATDLQGTLQAILTKLNTMSLNFPAFNLADFAVTNTDNSNLCLGKTISLNTSSVASDRLVAATATDSNPGTLIQKLSQGSGIVLDFSNPEQCVIAIDPNFTGGDEKVKSHSGDPTAGFLNSKIKATGDSSINIGASVDLSDNKVNIAASLNIGTLTGLILQFIQDNPATKEIFCSLVNSCPVACAAPTDASVSFS